MAVTVPAPVGMASVAPAATAATARPHIEPVTVVQVGRAVS